LPQALDAIKQPGPQAGRRALGKPQGYDALLGVLQNPEAAGISEEQADAPPPRVGDILVAQGHLERDQVEKALSEHPGEKTGLALVKARAASVLCGQALRTQKHALR
jgi:hypothetical protein